MLATLDDIFGSFNSVEQNHEEEKKKVQMTLLNPFAAAPIALTKPKEPSKKMGPQVMQWQQKRNEIRGKNILADEVSPYPTFKNNSILIQASIAE